MDKNKFGGQGISKTKRRGIQDRYGLQPQKTLKI